MDHLDEVIDLLRGAQRRRMTLRLNADEIDTLLQALDRPARVLPQLEMFAAEIEIGPFHGNGEVRQWPAVPDQLPVVCQTPDGGFR